MRNINVIMYAVNKISINLISVWIMSMYFFKRVVTLKENLFLKVKVFIISYFEYFRVNVTQLSLLFYWLIKPIWNVSSFKLRNYGTLHKKNKFSSRFKPQKCVSNLFFIINMTVVRVDWIIKSEHIYKTLTTSIAVWK